MTGLSNYSAQNLLNYLVGAAAMPALPASEWLALFTAVGNDSGSGMVEPGSGTGYLRTQIAGSLSTTSGTASGSAVLNITGVPAWIQIGMLVTDTTSPASIPVSSYVIAKTSGSVTLSNILPGVASGNSIRFTSFGPSVTGATYSLVNGAPIVFPQATAPGYTCPAFGIFDASGGGNMLTWDFFGLYDWGPFSSASGASGSGAVFNQAGHGFSNGNGVIVSPEFGGTLPTTTQGTLSGYALNYAANVAGDTYTLSSSSGAPASGNAVWTSNAGGGQARRVAPVVVPPGVQETIPVSGLYLSTYVTPTPAASLPLDIAPATAAYSFRKIRAAYAGQCCTAWNGSATQNIGFATDGSFDAAAFNAFSGAGAGNVGWFDQQSSNNAVLASGDYFDKNVAISLHNSKYAQNGVLTGGGHQLLRAPNVSAIQDIWGGASGGGLMFVIAASGLMGGVNALAGKGTTSWCFFAYPEDGTLNSLWLVYGTGAWGTQQGFGVDAGNNFHLVEVWYDNSTILTTNNPAQFYIDGTLCTLRSNSGPAAAVSDADGPLEIMNSVVTASESSALAGWMYEAFVYKGVPANLAALRTSLKTFYGIP